jgi:hypothetical protein
LNSDYYFVGPGGGDIIDGEQELFLEAFQDSRFLAPPILIGANVTDEFLPGTVILFNDAPVHHLDFVDGGSLLGIVQGTCTRTDRSVPISFDYTGEGVCQLTYEVLEGSHVVASFIAEGAVDNTIDGSVLTVTGGLGELEGVTGIVTLQAATLNSATTPPTVMPDGTLDFLSEVDGYYMTAELYVNFDVSFAVGDIPDDMEMGDDFTFTPPLVTVPPSLPPTSDFGGDDAFANPLGAQQGNGDHKIIVCPRQAQEDYCDCLADSDCAHFAHSRCDCAAARAPPCCNSL